MLRGLFSCLVVMLLFVVGCGKSDESSHPLFKKAESLSREGKFTEAVRKYNEYLDVNRASAITHYKLAEIYYDQLDDPLEAAYHFRRFLELEPDTADRDAITKWIEEAENRIAEGAMKRSPERFADAGVIGEFKKREKQYAECIRTVRRQNFEMARRLAALKRNGVDWDDVSTLTGAVGEEGLDPSASIPSTGERRPYPLKNSLERRRTTGGAETSPAMPKGFKSYTVCPGDTLCGISKKVYGSPKYHGLIFKANQGKLKSESAISIGQRLRIPPLPGK